MPQKSMLIKVLLAIAVKLAIVGAAVYWFWPTPKPVMPPNASKHRSPFRLRHEDICRLVANHRLPDHIHLVG